MKFRLLFWNLAGKDLSRLLCSAIVEHDIQFAAVCEADLLAPTLLDDLAWHGREYREVLPVTTPTKNKVRLFAQRTSNVRHEIVHETPTGRLVICRVVLPKVDVLVAAVHLDSKVNSRAEDQSVEAQHVASEIRYVEERFGHRRTIVIGDFNMNPFEFGVIGAAGFHGVMDKRIALEGRRMVKSHNYPFLYNPMWGAFGDVTTGPPGTHFYRNSEHHVLFWNMFDQVMLRPELLSYFDDRIAILDQIGGERICSVDGRPTKTIASDHFPLVVHLEFP